MRYVILIAFDPQTWDEAAPEQQNSWMDDHGRFEAYVAEHGRCIATAPLSGADTATTVRHRDGNVVVTDGPYVELVEQLAGYYDVELPDLDTAIEAAQLLPAAFVIEIRPVERVEAGGVSIT